MALMSPIWSRSLILVALVFGLLSFIVHPGVKPEQSARLEVRWLVGELFLYEGLEGRKSIEEVQKECAPDRPSWTKTSPGSQPLSETSCYEQLRQNTAPILERLRDISKATDLPTDAPERVWLAALSSAGFDIGPPSHFMRLPTPLPSHIPQWLRVRVDGVAQTGDPQILLQQIHELRRETWQHLRPWGAFFGLMLLMGLVGFIAWFLHKKIFPSGETVPSSVQSLDPVDALGYVGLWVLFMLVWHGLFPVFQLESAISNLLMVVIPQTLLGLFLIQRVCTRLGLNWGDLGLRVPTSGKNWVKLWGLSLLVFMMALPVVICCQILSSVIWDSMDASSPLILRVYEEGHMTHFVLISVILAPLFEEVFFRGFLFGSLRARMGANPANWTQGFVFALLHFNPVGFLPLLALGVVIGKVRERTGSVVPGILVHAFWNASVSVVTVYQLGG